MTINIHCNILRFSDLNGNLFFAGIIGGSAIISKNILMTNQTYGSFEGENKVTKRVKANPERKVFCQIRSGNAERKVMRPNIVSPANNFLHSRLHHLPGS
jgi:hypothetical protein